MEFNSKEDESGVFWNKIVTALKKNLSKESIELWIKPIRVNSFVDNLLELEVPSKFFKDKLEDNYKGMIETTASDIENKRVEIKFVVSPPVKENDLNKIQPTFEYIEAQTSSISEHDGFLNPKYTFESFVVGENNRFAHAACQAVAESLSKAYNPLFIYGGVGLGKTHLLHAIGHQIKNNKPKKKIVYVSSEHFMNEFIDSIRYGYDKSLNFKNKYRCIDLLLIDDIQFFEGKESTQDEFFHTFNTLYESRRQIVLTSDRPPREIPTLEDRLISRFEQGLITDIQPPDLETRMAILKKKSADEKIDIPDDVIYFIATKIKANIRKLEGALIRIIAYASFYNKIIDTSLANSVLEDVLVSSEPKKISMELIQENIAKQFKIQLTDLKGKRRDVSTAFPRQIAMYLCRDLTTHSLPEIGREFGGRDHTTVIHAYNKIKNQMDSDPKTKEIVERIITNIRNER
ncbi:MAG: chromosomal replication initiator protein DnaA [bacterium]